MRGILILLFVCVHSKLKIQLYQGLGVGEATYDTVPFDDYFLISATCTTGMYYCLGTHTRYI